MGRAAGPTVTLIEPIPIEDDLVTALSHVEDVGFGGRLVFYSEQTCFESGQTLCVIRRKIVVPRSHMLVGNKLVRDFLSGNPGPLRVVK